MARPLRIAFPGAVYHITSRGNERKAIFWDVLGQLASEGKAAEEAYRRFVNDGIAAESIWEDLRGESILGESAFLERMSDHVRGKESIPEISKSQRFVKRPTLESLFIERTGRDRRERDARIFEAVERHGYTQGEVADHLGLHFASVSRIMKTRGVMSTKDSAAKPLFPGFLKKMAIGIIEVFFRKAAHFSENRGFCSRINKIDLTPGFPRFSNTWRNKEPSRSGPAD